MDHQSKGAIRPIVQEVRNYTTVSAYMVWTCVISSVMSISCMLIVVTNLSVKVWVTDFLADQEVQAKNQRIERLLDQLDSKDIRIRKSQESIIELENDLKEMENEDE